MEWIEDTIRADNVRWTKYIKHKRIDSYDVDSSSLSPWLRRDVAVELRHSVAVPGTETREINQ